MNHPHTTPQAGRLLIGLYPARYRTAHGEDIAATFTEAAEGLNGRALLRERLDLASHALRLRLRIGATDPAGRMLAGAAPVVLGLVSGFCLWALVPHLPDLVHQVRHPSWGGGRTIAVESLLLAVALYLPWIFTLGAVAVGRPRAARALTLGATLTWMALSTVFDPWMNLLYGGAAFLGGLCAVLLLAPPTLVDRSARGRWEVTAVAISFGALLTLARDTGLSAAILGNTFFNTYISWPLLAAAAAVLGHLVTGRPDRYRAAGAGLVGVVWLLPGVMDGPRWVHSVGRLLGAYLVLVVLAVALAAGVRAVRRVRRAEPADPVA
ncbi:hypothetical protein [Kitasatospora sp. NPDC088346]|uniref:hypothetical protein n=1 Tax=Kitasatospora sp. NPDC088346 TaxID=3364073 RepID=UPI003827CC2B